jgi:hypothetical protein
MVLAGAWYWQPQVVPLLVMSSSHLTRMQTELAELVPPDSLILFK